MVPGAVSSSKVLGSSCHGPHPAPVTSGPFLTIGWVVGGIGRPQVGHTDNGGFGVDQDRSGGELPVDAAPQRLLVEVQQGIRGLQRSALGTAKRTGVRRVAGRATLVRLFEDRIDNSLGGS